MLHRSFVADISSFTLRSLTVGAISLLAAGCVGGCDDSSLICDDQGNCEVCDAYGCSPANGATGGSSAATQPGGAGGQGASSSGGGGEGGAGLGGPGGGGSGAAGGGCDPELTTCPCDEDPTACGDELYCLDDLCLPGCNNSIECGAMKVCANGKCVPGCSTADDCPHPNQICDNEICVVDPENPECDAQNPCPSPDVCEGGLCAGSCEENDDCEVGEICNSGSGACINDPSPAPMCDASTICPGVGQVCWTDGFCRYECNNLQACKLIDVRFDHCSAGVCKTDEEVNPECDLDNPCPGGMDCISNVCF